MHCDAPLFYCSPQTPSGSGNDSKWLFFCAPIFRGEHQSFNLNVKIHSKGKIPMHCCRSCTSHWSKFRYSIKWQVWVNEHQRACKTVLRAMCVPHAWLITTQAQHSNSPVRSRAWPRSEAKNSPQMLTVTGQLCAADERAKVWLSGECMWMAQSMLE